MRGAVARPQARSLSIRPGGFTYRKRILPWLFFLPILVINVGVVITPSLSAFYYAFTEWSGVGSATFTGLTNLRRLVADATVWQAFRNNLLWLTFFLTIPFALALLAAALLAPLRRGGLLFRAALFIPYVLPSVVTAGIWRNLMSPTQGIGAHLATIGIVGLDHAWLGRTDSALLAVAFVDNWHFWGFLMVLFLTAMQSVPTDLYEAARLDGANAWQQFRHVTLPGIRPTIAFMILMTAIWSFLVFDYVWILTQGGPAGASEVMGTLVYKHAFNRFDAGYASAIGLTMSFFAGIIIAIFITLRRRGWEI